MNRVVTHFFDKIFKNSEIDTREIRGELWFGLWDQDVILIGIPADINPNTYRGNWYYNGTVLNYGSDVFNMSTFEYNLSLKKYLNYRYPQLKILGII